MGWWVAPVALDEGCCVGRAGLGLGSGWRVADKFAGIIFPRHDCRGPGKMGMWDCHCRPWDWPRSWGANGVGTMANWKSVLRLAVRRRVPGRWCMWPLLLWHGALCVRCRLLLGVGLSSLCGCAVTWPNSGATRAGQSRKAQGKDHFAGGVPTGVDRENDTRGQRENPRRCLVLYWQGSRYAQSPYFFLCVCVFFFFVFFGGVRRRLHNAQVLLQAGRCATPVLTRQLLYWPAPRFADGALLFRWLQAPPDYFSNSEGSQLSACSFSSWWLLSFWSGAPYHCIYKQMWQPIGWSHWGDCLTTDSANVSWDIAGQKRCSNHAGNSLRLWWPAEPFSPFLPIVVFRCEWVNFLFRYNKTTDSNICLPMCYIVYNIFHNLSLPSELLLVSERPMYNQMVCWIDWFFGFVENDNFEGQTTKKVMFKIVQVHVFRHATMYWLP